MDTIIHTLAGIGGVATSAWLWQVVRWLRQRRAIAAETAAALDAESAVERERLAALESEVAELREQRERLALPAPGEAA